MAKRKERNFGQVIRDRRRQLNLTQQEIARRVKTSTPYVGHLESGKRHPSDRVLSRLAEVLGLDRRELFFLANPQAARLLQTEKPDDRKPTWEQFRKDPHLRSVHNIAPDEMEILSMVAKMGEIASPRDFIFILKVLRFALGR